MIIRSNMKRIISALLVLVLLFSVFPLNVLGAETTEATCTQDGFTAYTCACGHSYSEKLASELSYEKVSSLANDNRYVITLTSAGKYYALSHKNNTISAVQVTISNGVITSEITEDLIWDYSNKHLSYDDNGTTRYLYAKTSKLSISTSGTTNVSFSNNKIKVGTQYLRYSAGKISLNRTATTATLFKETVK